MKVSERIVAAEQQITSVRDAVSAIITLSETESRDLSDEEQAQVEEHAGTLETAQKNLASLKRAEQALAIRAASTTTAMQSLVPATAKAGKPGDLFVKMVAARMASHVRKTSVDHAIDAMYGGEAGLSDRLKAIVNPANTTTPGWAQELVHTTISGFMEELRGDSVYATLASLGTSIDFDGSTSVTIPGWAAGTGVELAGSFVAEGGAIPVKRGTMTSKSLSRYKMAVISTFTEELARASTPSIEALIRSKVLADTGQAIDTALLDTLPATAGVRPASILNGAPTRASAGVTDDLIISDLRFLSGVLTAANAGRVPVLLVHPTRILGLSLITNGIGQFTFRSDIESGRLLGFRLIPASYITPTVVVAMDAADFATAFSTPEFNLSDSATIVEASDVTAPVVGPISGAAGTTPPTPVRSLFQTWSLGLRMVMPLAWAMMRGTTVPTTAGTVAYLTAVAW